MANTRIWGNVPEERYEQMRTWAEELGLAFSQYVGLVSWLGAQRLRATLHPEQVFSPDQMADIIQAWAQKQGVELDPDKVRDEFLVLKGEVPE